MEHCVWNIWFINKIKKTKDNRCSLTVGSIAACLLKGMQSTRTDFNNGRDTATWLGAEIAKIIDEGKNDIDEEAVSSKLKLYLFK